ncbi:unnamed protein product [Protopolystoma xenopodis]|uniref:Uncharacterized protein n=1 Tax=Protopolystoma xenopodis TaxID=117903 RepID=A0A448WL53_9PLAT|nr:unnamed protein product [Protopolystoma xenopodis]
MLNFIVGLYYNAFIAWAVFYVANSFTDQLPWNSCGQFWNTANCIAIGNQSSVNQTSGANGSASSPAAEFFEYVLPAFVHSSFSIAAWVKLQREKGRSILSRVGWREETFSFVTREIRPFRASLSDDFIQRPVLVFSVMEPLKECISGRSVGLYVGIVSKQRQHHPRAAVCQIAK